MKTFIYGFAILACVLLCSSCTDKMYVKAPCQLKDLNVNGSLSQELGLLDPQESPASSLEDMTMGTLDLSLNFGTGKNYKVQIYTADPDTNQEDSYLIAYYILNDESTTELLCNLPEKMNNLYVGVTDEAGNRVVKSVAMLNGKGNVMFRTMMASIK